MSRYRRAGAAVAVAGGLAVIALQVWAVRGQSLTSDEPYHLLAGHQALRYGENTLNLEHPPLAKLLAALPLLAEPAPLAPRADVTRWGEASQAVFRDPALTRRLQHRSRAVLVAAFALPWLWTCYLLGRQVSGPRAGLVLALALGLSFSVVPYLPIVTTDAAVALGYGVTLVAAGRYLRAPDAGSAALLGAGLGLAVAAKYSGLFAAAPVGLALLLGPGGGAGPGRRIARALGHGAMAVAVAAALAGATYAVANHRYDAGRGREAIHLYASHQGTLLVEDRLLPWQGKLLAIERASPGLAQWLTGLLGIRAQNAIGVYPSYAFGRIERHGRWWYFPALLLLKTPVALLVATLAALIALAGRRRLRVAPRPGGGESDGPVSQAGETRKGEAPSTVHRRLALLLAGTAVVYLAAAVTSSYNLGYRHLLPVLPILLLPAAAWAARRTWAAAALLLLLAVESAALGPDWIAATNTWWLGEANPTRTALAGDNLDWKQGLVALAAEVRERGLGEVRVLDPLLSEAELAAYLPEARLVRPGAPVEPGWYAVAVLLEQYLPALLRSTPDEVYGHERYVAIARSWTPVWLEIRRRGDERGLAAGTFRLYRIGPEG
jgi:Dolichyl-phosphate-mannose-protein mannosyltransferase